MSKGDQTAATHATNTRFVLGNDRGIIEGHCEPAFEGVREAFLNNFEQHSEVGASVALTVDGHTVVDLWGGLACPRRNLPWDRDTVSVMFSSTKGITALVANMLIDQGHLHPDQAVAEIWPEYAEGAKALTTVRMMLDHTAGVPALREPLKNRAYTDWEYMCERIAAEPPFWEPGTRQAYHGVTFSWTVGELIRRVSGLSVGENIRTLLSGPLDLSLWCGLPESAEPRVAPMIPFLPGANPSISPMMQQVLEAPDSPAALFVLNDGGMTSAPPENPDTHNMAIDDRSYHAAEFPAANGIGNARALAHAYRPFALGGEFGGRRYISEHGLLGLEECSARCNRDGTLCIPSAFSLGAMKSVDARAMGVADEVGVLLGRRAFGHSGAGGSIGFADPEPRISFGYTMNRMGNTLGLTQRSHALVAATYQALGYRLTDAGFWIC